jgi:hypothetical protein
LGLPLTTGPPRFRRVTRHATRASHNRSRGPRTGTRGGTDTVGPLVTREEIQGTRMSFPTPPNRRELFICYTPRSCLGEYQTGRQPGGWQGTLGDTASSVIWS